MFTNVTRIVPLIAAAWLAAPAVAQCPPGTPGGVGATNGSQCNGVLIDWNSVSGATSYEIFRSTSQGTTGIHLADALPTSNTYLDITALPGVHYWYRVRAFRLACLPPNNVGPFGGPNEGWRGSTPGAPPNVQASDGSLCNGVEITWQGVGAPTYQIYRNENNSWGSAYQVGVIAGTSFTDLSAVSGFTHYYWVVAQAACGTSDPGGPDTGFTGVPTPTDLELSGPDCYIPGFSLTVSWSGVSAATLVKVYRNTTNNYNTSSLVGATNLGSWVDVSAGPQTTYYYWVKAESVCGSSPAVGPESWFTTSVLGAPENLAAAIGPECHSVTLSWDEATGSPAEDGYRLFRGSSDVFSLSQLLVTLPATSLAYTDLTVEPGFNYYYWVAANNSCGLGPVSVQPVQWQVPAPVSIVQHPQSVVVAPGDEAVFTVSASVPGANFQWFRNDVPLVDGGPISGAATPQLRIDPVFAVHAGDYRAEVSDPCVTVTSLVATLTVCYPDCNADGALTVADFGCFQTKFVLGDPYADCNADGAHTVSDFGCFQTKFVLGCP